MEKLTVLVTGSSRGIGRAIAIDLVHAGYTVVIHGRKDSEALRETLAEIRKVDGMCRALVFDVADRQDAGKVLSEDIEQFGTYYGVVCNAGISADGTFAAMPPQDWDRVIETDLGSFITSFSRWSCRWFAGASPVASSP